jgi:hypothetical protein
LLCLHPRCYDFLHNHFPYFLLDLSFFYKLHDVSYFFPLSAAQTLLHSSPEEVRDFVQMVLPTRVSGGGLCAHGKLDAADGDRGLGVQGSTTLPMRDDDGGTDHDAEGCDQDRVSTIS